MKRFLLLCGIIAFSVTYVSAQYDANFDLNGLLTGKWHKYKYDGGISG
jgi:hypothetical protein